MSAVETRLLYGAVVCSFCKNHRKIWTDQFVQARSFDFLILGIDDYLHGFPFIVLLKERVLLSYRVIHNDQDRSVVGSSLMHRSKCATVSHANLFVSTFYRIFESRHVHLVLERLQKLYILTISPSLHRKQPLWCSGYHVPFTTSSLSKMMNGNPCG
jgi:hypothetical protein